MSEPTTQAGRALLDDPIFTDWRDGSPLPIASWQLKERIAAIEAEARAEAEARLATAAERLIEMDGINAALREALAPARGMALSGAAYAHLESAGIMQDPPHDGKFAECRAPWCVRNQGKLAEIDRVLADTAAAGHAAEARIRADERLHADQPFAAALTEAEVAAALLAADKISEAGK